MSNVGHKLGEIDTTEEENTLERLRRNIKYEYLDSWKYLEFDINETKFGDVVVFHDRDFRKYGNKKKIWDYSVSEIKELYPQVPTLKELVDEIIKLGFKKPIRIEIKRLLTDAGRTRAINLARTLRYEGCLDVQFIAFRSHFKKSFPKSVRSDYALLFSLHDFKMLNVKNHSDDMFNPGKISSFLNWF